MDGLFSRDRGSRGSRFTHWLHTHPNAPAIPSGADADAAQWTEGTDMILGIRFSPEGHLPWFDDVDGKALKWSLEHNNVVDRCTIYEGDNRMTAPHLSGQADRVILGGIEHATEAQIAATPGR